MFRYVVRLDEDGRNGINIFIPKVKTEEAKKICYYTGAKEFNDLPLGIKSVISLLVFKACINGIFTRFDNYLLYLVNVNYYYI